MAHFLIMFKVDQLPRNLRKESWRKKKEEVDVSQRQAVSTSSVEKQISKLVKLSP